MEEVDRMKKLFSTTDGFVWATEWCFIAKELGPEKLIDVNWMTGWFANAIEVAKSDEYKRLLGHNYEGFHQFHQILKKDPASRTPVDKVMVAAIMLLSSKVPFTLMTMEQIFDHFVEEHDVIYKLET